MKCAACGAEAPENSSFCPKCGAKIGAAPVADGPMAHVGVAIARNAASNDAEEKLWEGNYSAKSMVTVWFGTGVATILLIVLSLIFAAAAPVLLGVLVILWMAVLAVLAYRKLNIHYELTSQRLIHQTGILSRTSDRIEMIDIDDVAFHQDVIERMFNVGTIRITSSDRTHPTLRLIGIDDVKRVADLVDETRRKERRRRGLHIESI